MATTELHDVSLAIGEIRRDVAHAEKSRAITHQKLEAIQAQVAQISATLDRLTATVAEMRPEVQHYARTRQQVIGGKTVLVVIWGIVGGVVVKAADFLWTH